MSSSDYTVQTLELKLKVSEFGQLSQVELNIHSIFNLKVNLKLSIIFLLVLFMIPFSFGIHQKIVAAENLGYDIQILYGTSSLVLRKLLYALK